MSNKCRAYSESKLGLEPPENRKAFYAGWDAALRAALAEPVQEPVAFGIEERAGVPVLFSKDGGCRPATAEEWLMWGIISAAINGDKERAHGIEGDA